MLLLPVVRLIPAWNPMPMFLVPLLFLRALAPTAVLLLPTLLQKSALRPNAVLSRPTVLVTRAIISTSWASSTVGSRPPGLAAGPGGVIVYWHVDNVATTLERLLSLGAEQLDGVRERGPGFVTASGIDPFGNVVGIMYNRHYLEVLGKRPQGAGQ